MKLNKRTNHSLPTILGLTFAVLLFVENMLVYSTLSSFKFLILFWLVFVAASEVKQHYVGGNITQKYENKETTNNQKNRYGITKF